MKISIFLKMMWVSWQMQKWEVQIIFASSFWFFTFIQNPRKPNVVLHNPIWDLRKYQPLKWEGCCGLGDEQLHRPSPETNSKFSPENQWLEDNMSFWGVSAYFLGANLLLVSGSVRWSSKLKWTLGWRHVLVCEHPRFQELKEGGRFFSGTKNLGRKTNGSLYLTTALHKNGGEFLEGVFASCFLFLFPDIMDALTNHTPSSCAQL